MSEFVRKTALGGYKLVPGGYSDPEMSHVIMTKAEYDGMLDQIQNAKREEAAAAAQADQRVRSIKSQADSKIQQIQAAADKAAGELQEELSAERAERKYQQELNSNLLRISKERANASRKLKPKKEHSGYVVISSTEKDHYYKYGANRRKAILWETVLQTPFSIDFTEDQARTESEELFQEDETGVWLLGKIGIDAQYLDGYGRLVWNDKAEEWLQYNVMVEKKLRANFRAGYWELIILHTKPLGIVPAEMRP